MSIDNRFKTIYDRNARLLPEGVKASDDITRALMQFMNTYVAQGYSPREIGALMTASAHDAEVQAVLSLPYAPLSSVSKIKTQ